MDKYEEARKLAQENYSEWGQWVVECMNDNELKESFVDYKGNEMTLSKWIEVRKSVAEVHKENASWAESVWSW